MYSKIWTRTNANCACLAAWTAILSRIVKNAMIRWLKLKSFAYLKGLFLKMVLHNKQSLIYSTSSIILIKLIDSIVSSREWMLTLAKKFPFIKLKRNIGHSCHFKFNLVRIRFSLFKDIQLFFHLNSLLMFLPLL